jgi:hypothetical protein
MDGILPGPAGGSEQGIEAIRIGSGISLRNNLSPELSGLGGVRHPPLDHCRIEGYFELCCYRPARSPYCEVELRNLSIINRACIGRDHRNFLEFSASQCG